MDLLGQLSSSFNFNLVNHFILPIMASFLASLVFIGGGCFLGKKVFFFRGNNFLFYPLLATTLTGIFSLLQHSLALSLGVMGALSLVRFRLAIKSSLDIVFILVFVAVGLFSSMQLYTSLFVFILLILLFIAGVLVFSKAKIGEGASRIVVIQMSKMPNDSNDYLAEIRHVLGNDILLKDFKISEDKIHMSFVVVNLKNEKLIELSKILNHATISSYGPDESYTY